MSDFIEYGINHPTSTGGKVVYMSYKRLNDVVCLLDNLYVKCNRKWYPYPFGFKSNVQNGVTRCLARNTSKIIAFRVILWNQLQPIFVFCFTFTRFYQIFDLKSCVLNKRETKNIRKLISLVKLITRRLWR